VSRQLLFVESNTTGSGMIALATARRLGYEPVFLTSAPDRYSGLAGTGATVVLCDTNSPGPLRRAVERLERGRIAGVTTTSEFYLPAVARLAQSLGLPGNPPQVLAVCRNKGAVRRALRDAGLPQPRFAEVTDPAQAPAAVAHTGLPCVVKPTDDSGSNNVRVCATVAEAVAQVEAVLAVRFNVRGQRMAGAALVEEYVRGEEFSVEMFSFDGHAECVGVTRKSLTDPPHCVETGHRFPSGLDPAEEAELVDVVGALLGALGVRSGPTHTEIKRGPHGPAVIELNCRLAGGMIPELVRHARGVDLIEQQLRCAAGERPDTAGDRDRWAGIRFVTADRPGVLRGVPGLEAARAVPGVVRAEVTKRPGDTVGPPRNAYDRIGYVIAAADTPHEVTAALEAAALRPDLDPGKHHVIELRSDTFTHPTEAMRQAAATAEVGDDVYGEDPTVRALEARAAALTGKDAAVLMPSGTMANLAAVMSHARRGEKVVLGVESDAYVYEAGGASVCGGVVYAPVRNLPDGTLDPAELDEAFDVDRDDPQFAHPALICLESTHSRCGGAVLPVEYLRGMRAYADRHAVAIHLDGARLFNAAVALGVPAAEIARYADSVQFCLSKGLSAPIGSMLAGDAAFVARARRIRKMLGGGMRQAGMIAAAGLVALETMVDRLADDHDNARRLAEGLRELDGVEVDPMPQSNIVMFRVRHPVVGQQQFIDAMGERGIRLAELGRGRIRAVTHAGVPAEAIDTVLAAAKEILA
jgi:threonine aldolase